MTSYIRGRIPIPIHGPAGDLDEPFIWGVWAEISPKNFIRTFELWDTPGREDEPPFPGYLNSEIPIFGPTINLELDVHYPSSSDAAHTSSSKTPTIPSIAISAKEYPTNASKR